MGHRKRKKKALLSQWHEALSLQNSYVDSEFPEDDYSENNVLSSALVISGVIVIIYLLSLYFGY